ncbi:beta-ketoacyl synthase N-terminal-like domain-containing protein [Nonomuraea salmonea]|uniref:beta-ketoacyl synthase N-terminal-like domain-containing protein n=1 Tax=Nonomuraea salmonea TaxID=46181 RepID=UPI002FE9E366
MNAHDDLVAVTGLACRFPGAPDADALWRLLVEEREGLTWLTDDELAARGVPGRLRRDPAYVPVAGLIEGQDLFDPEPFGLTDGEAALMDPQQRLFLEICWRALEQAGHGGGRGAGAVGGSSPGRRRALTWRPTCTDAGTPPAAARIRAAACRRPSPRRPTTCPRRSPTGWT